MTLSTALTAAASPLAVVGEMREALMVFLVDWVTDFFGMALAHAPPARDSEPPAPNDPPYASDASNLHPAHRAQT